MTIALILNTPDNADEIVILNDYIREQNLKGMMTQLTERPPQPGEMSVGDYMPFIQMLFGSAATAAGIKGLFDLIKAYFDLKKHKISAGTELEKAKIAANAELEKTKITTAAELEKAKITVNAETAQANAGSKATLNFELPSGKKVAVALNTFDETERALFIKTLNEALEQ